MLLGVALGALAAGAASAQEMIPEFHLAQKDGGVVVKSRIREPARHYNTGTETIDTSVSASADLNHKVDLGAFAWLNRKKCIEAKPQYYKNVPRKTSFAEIRTGVTTGTENGCGNAIYKFHNVYYKLTSGANVGSTDHFTAPFFVPLFEGTHYTTYFKFNVYIAP